ncbi:MAG: response regulator [Rhizomicrobium sp.]
MADILIVDDSASIRHTVKIALGRHGFTIHEAANGLEGLQKASEQRFDLFLVDLNMPQMDGMSMIRELRTNTLQAGVPILFLTTESDNEVKLQAKEAGATGWLTKPFDADQLLKVVNRIVAK